MGEMEECLFNALIIVVHCRVGLRKQVGKRKTNKQTTNITIKKKRFLSSVYLLCQKMASAFSIQIHNDTLQLYAMETFLKYSRHNGILGSSEFEGNNQIRNRLLVFRSAWQKQFELY